MFFIKIGYVCRMYLYNISIIVEDTANAAVLHWVKSEFIPSLPVAFSPQFLSLLDSPHEGYTYSLQLKFDERQLVENFKAEYVSILQNHLMSQHPERAFIFDSVMQYLLR